MHDDCGSSLTLVFRNDLDGLLEGAGQVNCFLEKRGCNPKVCYRISLAFEEMVTNIIKYGYDDEDPHTIACRLEDDGSHISLSIKDDGHMFDPCSVLNEVDIHVPLEQRKVGGLGIFMVHSMCDVFHYVRQDNHWNILLVKVKLDK